MKFPEQEIFSLEDVAARWGKSTSYVQDLTRRGVLPVNRGFLQWIGEGTHRRLTLIGRITRHDLEQFEKTYGIGISRGEWKHLKEAASLLDISEKTLRRRLKDHRFRWKRDGKRIFVFISAEFLSK